jgi:hypothetical protein
MSAEWHVSLKPQRVSAALASGVNLGSSGAASSSTSLAHAVGSMPISRAGLSTATPISTRQPKTWLKRSGPGGWSCGTSPRSAAKPSTCAGRKRLFACATRCWELYRLPVSCRKCGSSFCRLCRNFPFVEIKIEPELVAGCAHDRAKRTLCRHIVRAASQFGARTVAVGVETYADFVTARELGFDMIQGFLFAKPMGAQGFVHTMGRDLKSPLIAAMGPSALTPRRLDPGAAH